MQEVKIFKGTDSKVIGLKLEGSSVVSLLCINIVDAFFNNNNNNNNNNNDNNGNFSFSIQLKLQLQISLLQR